MTGQEQPASRNHSDLSVVTGPARRGPTAGDAVAAAVACAGGLVVLNVLAAPALVRLGLAELPPAAQLGVGAVVSEAGILAPLLALVAMARLGIRETFALSRPPAWPTIFAVVAVVGGGVLLDEVMYLTVRFVPALESPGLVAMGRDIAGAGLVGALALVPALALGPALVEEALCRGVVLRGLGSRLSPVLALLLSSAYFGILHFDPLHALVAFLMGLLLGFVALRTGSLWPAVACHLVNNVVSVLTPALGGPSLPEVMAHGHSAPALVAGVAAVAAGLAGMVATSRRAGADRRENRAGHEPGGHGE